MFILKTISYNSGRLANDPKLAWRNFFKALERMPNVLEAHEKALQDIKEKIPSFEQTVQRTWKKEDELISLKEEITALDKSLAESLQPQEDEKEQELQIQQSIQEIEVRLGEVQEQTRRGIRL